MGGRSPPAHRKVRRNAGDAPAGVIEEICTGVQWFSLHPIVKELHMKSAHDLVAEAKQQVHEVDVDGGRVGHS